MQAASRTEASASCNSDRSRLKTRGSPSAAIAQQTCTRADACSSRLSCNKSPNARGSRNAARPRAPRRQVSSARLAVACSSGSSSVSLNTGSLTGAGGCGFGSTSLRGVPSAAVASRSDSCRCRSGSSARSAVSSFSWLASVNRKAVRRTSASASSLHRRKAACTVAGSNSLRWYSRTSARRRTSACWEPSAQRSASGDAASNAFSRLISAAWRTSNVLALTALDRRVSA